MRWTTSIAPAFCAFYGIITSNRTACSRSRRTWEFRYARCRQISQKYLGHSLLDELTQLRVEHAKKLLANRRLKIETVGVESGFSSRFHFIRAFQRVTGVTPKAYRRDLP